MERSSFPTRRFRIRVYRAYDRVMTRLQFPARYCSQCEKRIRYWIYHFKGLTYCQGCADAYVAKLEEAFGRLY